MKILLIKLASIFTIILSTIVLLTSCSNNFDNPLIFANFESYMSEDLKSRLKNEFNELKFDFYTSNENMITNFKNGTYTIGNASTYAVIELIKQEELEPIDWSKFNLKKPITNEPINNENDALSLFIEPVRKILTGFDEIPNLLKYCIPYFFQNYLFAYRGQKILDFENPNITWENILDIIGSKPNVFNSARMGGVEDERTLFSVSNLVNSNNQNVNPINLSLKPSIDEYKNVYKQLSNGNRINTRTLGKNPIPIFLNSDSSVILNKLATNSLNGAMMFNGDAIFAAQGGEDALDKLPSSQDFHFVSPIDTPLALDCLVINKKNVVNNDQRMQTTYKILNQTALEGSDSNDPNDFEKLNSDNLFFYGPMLNFSFVQYVSPLKIISGQSNDISDNDKDLNNIDKNIINSVVYTNDYFLNLDDPDLGEAIKNAYTISIPDNIPITNLIESPLNSWQKQTIINSYLRFKEEFWN
ncbi:hypothetical protein [Mycoplasmoides pirum]|uniref:hypothetical protein n=1 Tax=Mycoplasmoides pirum TaxID=2122 RepID=UPI0006983435|nr:hypothetical protein [Mycoplasmoides pirum]